MNTFRHPASGELLMNENGLVRVRFVPQLSNAHVSAAPLLPLLEHQGSLPKTVSQAAPASMAFVTRRWSDSTDTTWSLVVAESPCTDDAGRGVAKSPPVGGGGQDSKVPLPGTAPAQEWSGAVQQGPPEQNGAARSPVGTAPEPTPVDDYIETGDEEMFSVHDGVLLRGSGVFFALKIMKARSVREMVLFEEEVEKLRTLRDQPRIVQIKDFAQDQTGHVMILMELAACDLRRFLKSSPNSSPSNASELLGSGVSKLYRIWHALVASVNAAHKKNIIHRDLKPENFLLVPVGPCRAWADRILATTPTPLSEFRFRFFDDDEALTAGQCADADAELTLLDSSTGEEVVIELGVRLSDFGIALELASTHLSVEGFAGTIQYSAPETLKISEDSDRQQLSMRADMWSLGVMLFELLHSGRTVFERFKKKGRMHLGMAIVDARVHRGLMKDWASKKKHFWEAERKALEIQYGVRAVQDYDLPSEGGGVAAASSSFLRVDSRRRTINPHMIGALVTSYLQMDLLFRMCKRCLAFEAPDRVDCCDLISWMECVADRGVWWIEDCAESAGPEVGGASPSCSRVILRMKRRASSVSSTSTAPSEDSSEGAVEVEDILSLDQESVLCDAELERVGATIGRALFPELFRVDHEPEADTAGEKEADTSSSGVGDMTPVVSNVEGDSDMVSSSNSRRIVQQNSSSRGCMIFRVVAAISVVVGLVVGVVAIFVVARDANNGSSDPASVGPEVWVPSTSSSRPTFLAPVSVTGTRPTPVREEPPVNATQVPEVRVPTNGSPGPAARGSPARAAKGSPARAAEGSPAPAARGSPAPTTRCPPVLAANVGSPARTHEGVAEALSTLLQSVGRLQEAETAADPSLHPLAAGRPSMEPPAFLDKDGDGSGRRWKGQWIGEILDEDDGDVNQYSDGLGGLRSSGSGGPAVPDEKETPSACSDDTFASVRNWLSDEFGLAPVTLEYAADELKDNRDFVLARVQANGLALQFASAGLKGDKEIVLAAVRENGLSLKYALEALKSDKEIVLAAVEENASAFEFASGELQIRLQFAIAGELQGQY